MKMDKKRPLSFLRSKTQERMQSDAGYKLLLERPDVRRRIAESILNEGKPYLIGYYSVADEVAKELNLQVDIRTAYKFLTSSQEKIGKFVFENLIKDDKAYRSFIEHAGFRKAVFQAFDRYDLSGSSTTILYNNIKRIVAEIEKAYNIDTLNFLTFFLLNKPYQRRILEEVGGIPNELQ